MKNQTGERLRKLASMEMDINTLKHIIRKTFWMARRYAHGRQTGSPSTIRECYQLLKVRFPDLVPKKDVVIEPPDPKDVHGMTFRSDYLDDCNE